MGQLNLGVAKRIITPLENGLQLQGMVDPMQLSKGVLGEKKSFKHDLFARSFIIQDQMTDQLFVIVVADIWSGTRFLKDAVIERLHALDDDDLGSVASGAFTHKNVMIAGTHTHSAPGGYTGYQMFDFGIRTSSLRSAVSDVRNVFGTLSNVFNVFNQATFDRYASGIAESIAEASRRLQPGKLYANTGHVENCGFQRSRPAFLNNPASDLESLKNQFGADAETDKSMLLLKFVGTSDKGDQQLGALNWFALHPVDLGQSNMFISGDNKGLASLLFEDKMRNQGNEDFVAGFANSNCGDVTVNINIDPRMRDPESDRKGMKENALRQFSAAIDLYENAVVEIKGEIKIFYSKNLVDFSDIEIRGSGGERTWPHALGLSFAAGSTEDSFNRLDEVFSRAEDLTGVSINTIINSINILGAGLPTHSDLVGLREGIVADPNGSGEYAFLPASEADRRLLSVLSMAFTVLFRVDSRRFPDPLKRGHMPKPVVFAAQRDGGLAPHRLPLQCFRLGPLAVIGFPGEITTIAGRRLIQRVKEVLAKDGRDALQIGLTAYANDYGHYVTTKEEYLMQHYEGASTAFGPATLDAFIQEFEDILETSV